MCRAFSDSLILKRQRGNQRKLCLASYWPHKLLNQMPPQIIFIGFFQFDIDKIADFQVRRAIDKHLPVDFRRIGFASCHRAFFNDFIDQYRFNSAYPLLQALGADFGLVRHKPGQSFLFDCFRYLIGQVIGNRAFDRGLGKAADSIHSRFTEKIQQLFEFLLGFAGKADDKRAAQGNIGTDFAPCFNALQVILTSRRTFH